MLFAALVAAAFAVRAQTCVVLDFQLGEQVTAEEVENISYEFRSTFKPSCYTVMDPGRVRMALKNRGYNTASITKEQVRKLGRDLVANVVVYGTLMVEMGEYVLDVDVLDVSEGHSIQNEHKLFQKSEYRSHTRAVSQGLAAKLCNGSRDGSSGGSSTGSGSGYATAPAKPPVPAGYTDLGLPSGTLWKNYNATGFYTYDEAVSQFGNRLPTKAQWEELKAECQWKWTGSGYTVTGPNGNSISLPASGFRNCGGSVGGVGSYGGYWSSTPNGSDYAWNLYFHSGSVRMNYYRRCGGRSVRLVQD